MAGMIEREAGGGAPKRGRPYALAAGAARVLYEDNHLLGVYKPGGWLVQGDRTGDPTLMDWAKDYLKRKYLKPGNVFLGLVHRLDRPASGVMLFARTSKAASRLADEFRLRRAKKTYLAVVLGSVEGEVGELVARIERVRARSRIAGPGSERSREASLEFRVLERRRSRSLLEVRPSTGRHHQIRLQLQQAGHPIVGDMKYGAREPLDDRTIALHAGELVVAHPTRRVPVRLVALPPAGHPWSLFAGTLTRWIDDRSRERGG